MTNILKIYFYIILIFHVLSSCKQPDDSYYDNLTKIQCDSLLQKTALTARERCLTLIRLAELSHTDKLNVKSKNYSNTKSLQLLQEALHIAPKNLQNDIKLYMLSNYTIQLSYNTIASEVHQKIRKLIIEIESSVLTPKQKGVYLYNKSNYYKSMGAYKEALETQEKSRKIFHAIGDKESEYYVFKNIIPFLLQLKYYDKALEYCDSLQNFSGYVCSSRQSQSLAKLRSLIYDKMGEPDKAIKVYQPYMSDSSNIAFKLNLYMKADRHQEALECLRQHLKKPLHPFSRYWYQTYEADCLQALKSENEARQLREKILSEMQEYIRQRKTTDVKNICIPIFYARIYIELAKWYEKNGRLDKAIHYLQQGAKLNHTNVDATFYQHFIQIQELLTQYYQQSNKYREAFQSYTTQIALQQKLDQKQKNLYYKEIWNNYEIQLQKEQISKQKADIHAIQSTRKFLAGLCLLLALTAILFILLYRNRQHSLNILYKKQKELEQTTTMTSRFPLPPENNLSPEQQLFQKLLQQVEDQRLYAKPDFSLEELTSLSGTNRSYVSAAINNCTGSNFNQWINRLRMNYILNHIHETTPENLAKEAGFASGSSLYRYFKVYTGMTIKQYLNREKTHE